jgi:NAD(P)H-hydrate epimerase
VPVPQYLSRDQVRAVDRIAIEQFHVPGIVLMENAARGVADEACRMLNDAGAKRDARSILILCGGGNNGGDGLAAARHLSTRGVAVTIGLTIDPAKYRGDALINWSIVNAMALPVVRDVTPDTIDASRHTLVIDALFGTGLTAPPRPPFDALANALATDGRPVLSVDLPSGLDCDTGHPLGPVAIRATRTITFVAPKRGFANTHAQPWLGDHIITTDIACPLAAIEQAIANFP